MNDLGKDDLFKKRREARKKRDYAFRTPKANSFLIVTEGKCTEPNYINGLKEEIIAKIGGTVDIVEVPEIDIHGEGASTEKLIEITEQYVSKANIIYQNIWVVFDKDDFLNFDKAIAEGEEKGYSIAWSNQSFEYWLYLHFHYSDADLHRHQWNAKLDELFKSYGLNKSGYSKNIKNLYSLLDSFGGVDAAISNAKRRMAGFDSVKDKPSLYAPGTKVHLLIEQLRRYLE
ncbi:RloB family protein [Butyrivibrio sp. TB]|uniref:RloB family protein n=1 Tax=Butyrivibrio sp. TB TaxID=1520809 RepID=UPI001FA8D88E